VKAIESMPGESGATEKWIALLGRKDVPADGIVDYCACLGKDLAKLGIELKPVRVEWATNGWLRALANLWRCSKDWRGTWVMGQYTAMAWSNRGFPVGALACAAILRVRGVRGAMVFHEPGGTAGPRLIDRARCAFQNWTVRNLYRFAEKSVFTVPLASVWWLPRNDAKSVFIPLGSNIPENLTNRSELQNQNAASKNVVVFCLSDSPHGEREVADVAAATRVAASAGTKIRVVFVGRGTSEARTAIERAFAGSPVEVSIRGLCEAMEVARIFSESSAMLAVRGSLYPRRGSALAGIACGLPIIGYAGAAEGTIIEEAGVMLVPLGDRAALGAALRNVVTNEVLWRQMHERNLRVQREYFSWNVIAATFNRALGARKA
jgi:glycosyltransferase involved in cell wall biosynthesis